MKHCQEGYVFAATTRDRSDSLRGRRQSHAPPKISLRHEQILDRFTAAPRHALLGELDQLRRDLCFSQKRTLQFAEIRESLGAKLISK